LIIDNIQNAGEYSSSRRILQEVHNYCPQVKVEFAYSLAKGGVALHAKSKTDRDFLAKKLPEESFGCGTKQPPKGKAGQWFSVYIKGVDTSADVQRLSRSLEKEGVSICDIRRLTKRYTGRPTQVVKVKCDKESADKLINIKVVVNNKRCIVERDRGITVIRCFHCQTLGHVAKNCTNTRRCEFCAQNHGEREICDNENKPLCVNCLGSHPSSSSYCPAFRKRHETLAEQHTKHNHIYTVAAACSKEVRY